ncbi:MAG: PhzF family phenazine biosynthesis protein [Alphaproteobacteria bacterium]
MSKGPVPRVDLVSVFPCDGTGGNKLPVVLDAAAMSRAEMQEVARTYSLESGFVLPSDPGDTADFRFRFFVPQHEMDMCGHATIGMLWLLRRAGRLVGSKTAVRTSSGILYGYVDGPEDNPIVEITQPRGRVQDLELLSSHRAEILAVLGADREDLAEPPIQNVATSRVKTLVPICDPDRLAALQPDFTRVEGLCGSLNSTGLYPYAPVSETEQTFEARQFPRDSGYPEDAATGIAATALAFGLLEAGTIRDSKRPLTVYQGRAMGRLSKMRVRFTTDAQDGSIVGCLLSGDVVELKGVV